MRLAKTLVLGSLLAAAGSGLHAQTTTAPAAKPATKAAPKSAAPKASTKKAPKAPAAGQAEPTETKVARRDPFESLTSRQDAAAKNAANLPPGKAGLQVASLRLDGIVRSPNGMIAVVTNPQSRTYFLREGDQLYDGRVDKIGMDNVAFHELARMHSENQWSVKWNKRLYSSAGDQQ